MNLYAIIPSHAPHDEVTMFICDNDELAMEHGIFVAAQDIVQSNYFSPSAEVYKVAPQGLELIGTAKAVDAPASWGWAHPAVDDHAVEWEKFVAECSAQSTKGPKGHISCEDI